MISIIILSSKKDLTAGLLHNINDTISCEYETIVIENADRRYGICEAYNLAANKSKYPILVFAHEDMLFHTKKWGQILINTLNDPSIGIVGAAGAIFKSNYPIAWGDIDRKYVVQSAIASWKRFEPKAGYKPFGISKVAVIDGFFMCMRKNVWKEMLFNESDLKGFHLYDIDICLKTGRKFKIVVTHDIITEHFSRGNFSKDWFLDCIKIHKKRKKYLPIAVENIKSAEFRNLQYISLIKSINYFLRFRIKSKILWSYVVMLFIYKPWSKLNFKILSNFLIFNFSEK